HQFQRRGVDMKLLDRHVLELRCQLEEQSIPQHVGVSLRIRLCDHREPPAPRAGKLERETQNALNAAASVHGGLQRYFIGRVHGECAAVVDILPFGVFTNDDEIDRLLAAERPAYAGEGPGRTYAGVEIERLA